MNIESLASLTSKETGLSQSDTRATLKAAIKIIPAVVASGEKVELDKFGTFHSQMRSIRTGRDTKGNSTYVPAPILPVFFAGKDFLEAVNK
jgi:nucleoid DNA-binding protein